MRTSSDAATLCGVVELADRYDLPEMGKSAAFRLLSLIDGESLCQIATVAYLHRHKDLPTLCRVRSMIYGRM